jgi:hypothetical protein
MKVTMMFRKYIRTPDKEDGFGIMRKGSPRGVAVLVRVDDEIRYGYSLLNVNRDKYDKEEGIEKALYRAMSDGYQLPKVPEREKMVMDAFKYLEERAIKYFKDLDPKNIMLEQDESPVTKWTEPEL